jgi:hypothetical protein
MTDRTATGAPGAALERALREGPVDEAGYRAEAVDLSADAHVESLRAGRSSVRLGRRTPGATPAFAWLETVAALLVVAFMGSVILLRALPGGFGASPAPTDGTSASPIPVPALTETFVSTRNGFSVRYPSGWSATPATTSWVPGTFLPIGNPALDELQLAGAARLVVASQRLEAGQTEASWLASFGQQYYLRRCSGDRAAWPRVTVDGRSGYLDLNGCPLASDSDFSTPDIAFDAIVFAGDRVYRIGLDGVVDLAYFEAILATVQLDPASAIDPPASP